MTELELIPEQVTRFNKYIPPFSKIVDSYSAVRDKHGTIIHFIQINYLEY